MNAGALMPLPIEKVQFKLAYSKNLPTGGGCYLLTTFDGGILYIGQALNLKKRFTDHLDTPEKTAPTVDGKAIWFYYLNYDPKNLSKLERTWLNQYLNFRGRLPILNKVNSPIS